MSDEETLRILNRQYVDAFLNCDVEWYRQHVTDDFICIESDGTLLEKAAFLQGNSFPHDVVSYDLLDVRVRIFGEVALIHSHGKLTRKDGRTSFSRYTDCYAKFGDEWKAISAQFT